ncbi:hypothetical protein N7481_012343 [Penicillium waksmanii]|uniref:uncharacterized protein n=1 Tax=Penicillium waksmanii TaxID=69791 RepID=UPI002546D094|nr:uncharacterized protein N7481_012343 [Penicillium waksmanii]KAJ5965629.1 hypothetical protein N7481_012343 [Penicillium waksmanii]
MLEPIHLLILGAVTMLGLMVFRALRLQHDPREPPVLPSKIPVIGHLLGMIFEGLPYWHKTANENPTHGIFTLNLLFTKVYIVSSTEVIRLMQRNQKTLTFDPVTRSSIKAFSGIDDERTLRLIIGEALDRMNLIMMRNVKTYFDELQDTPSLDLYRWVRNMITVASTRATYGPLNNPYNDPEVADGFWDFENNLNTLLSNFLQWLTARKAWKGRRKVTRAFYAYYKKHGIEEGSALAKMRYNKSMKQGMSLEDFSKLEAPVLLAFLSSTVPAVFWAIFELFSNPQLLAEFRSEIELNALSISEDGTHTINITAVKEHCPFALSFLQEVLRFRTTTITLRHIIEDTMLASAIGKRADVWGDSAGVFDPRRFLKADPSKANSKEPRRTGGFTAFGLAPVICPGRHFASTEVLGVAAMMALRYDINPVGGIWKAPSINTGALSSSMSPVKGEFLVNVKPREKYEGAKWMFHFEAGQGQSALNVG